MVVLEIRLHATSSANGSRCFRLTPDGKCSLLWELPVSSESKFVLTCPKDVVARDGTGPHVFMGLVSFAWPLAQRPWLPRAICALGSPRRAEQRYRRTRSRHWTRVSIPELTRAPFTVTKPTETLPARTRIQIGIGCLSQGSVPSFLQGKDKHQQKWVVSMYPPIPFPAPALVCRGPSSSSRASTATLP